MKWHEKAQSSNMLSSHPTGHVVVEEILKVTVFLLRKFDGMEIILHILGYSLKKLILEEEKKQHLG